MSLYRILVVDDTPANLTLANRMLGTQNELYEVLNAHDYVGANTEISQAFESNNPIDIILMDVHIGSDYDAGIRAARNIREQYQQNGKNVVLLAYTSMDSIGNLANALKDGIFDGSIIKVSTINLGESIPLLTTQLVKYLPDKKQ